MEKPRESRNKGACALENKLQVEVQLKWAARNLKLALIQRLNSLQRSALHRCTCQLLMSVGFIIFFQRCSMMRQNSSLPRTQSAAGGTVRGACTLRHVNCRASHCHNRGGRLHQHAVSARVQMHYGIIFDSCDCVCHRSVSSVVRISSLLTISGLAPPESFLSENLCQVAGPHNFATVLGV